MIELLAPAGDFERLKIAFLYGADAVYVGGRDYSLRANATNFSKEELKEANLYAHNLGKKLYVTVNIVFHNEDINGLKEYLLYLASIKVDAIIISDLLVIETIKKYNIPLEMHLSTQASTLNYEAALFYKNLGVKRVVMAREASKEDIKRVKKETGLDIECFIHGAMCVSFSGRCVLSNYCTNRDSNRGGCAQICRWSFNNPLTTNDFSFTPKDLNMVKNIKEMIDIGVNSFKVEGRMRSIYYIATVIGTYREIIDKSINDTLKKEDIIYYQNILNRCAARDSDEQFFNGLPNYKDQYYLGREEMANKDFLGIVISYDNNTKEAIIEQRNYFNKGNIVEFFGPNKEALTYTIEDFYDKDNNKIDVANHPLMLVKMRVDLPLKANDMMRLKVFDKQKIM